MLRFGEFDLTIGLRDWLRFVHHEDRPMVGERLDRLIAGRGPRWESCHDRIDREGRPVVFLRRGNIVDSAMASRYA
jgi:hypothetical protein